MFDARIRPLIDPLLNRLGLALANAGVGPIFVTLVGFAMGMGAAVAIAAGYFLLGFVLIAFNRIADGLDGAVARATRKTDLGGYLDITLDFVFYGVIPLAFALQDPAANALPAAALLCSFYANGSAFLAFAIMAERRGLSTDRQGQKSLYYLGGLAEGTETIALFLLMALLPDWFPVLAWAFAAVCFVSAGARVMIGVKSLDR
ncbi:phosphatidylglycerophosphate synthase [Labrenzia sp. EL_208]|uniref:CDP-alcohol phosphatidyltransferase family protein n=1 Tax=Roseibium album TaxID=311410 RepID=UPI000CF16376|nr:phosphatidylglycerophosphate synthase [Labrenzia sp. EL_142]MBG6155219.1 phosphatidylglycerophosphate synthase [Labrenzia sp. EL_162]MBG6173801.1 phosphatidylglycerophosphate synthase [Labrenzia sp. EL_132]MBG6192651.1 phosphatidylglycerophosphate synthase [Labrenzia sp. EL_159]MBG6228743.1 phosphatidylglycerophosphate synthase [Labrenzia sp. EL_208]